MDNQQATPPYLHKELANIPTHRIVEELLHRLDADFYNTYEIWPDGFNDLAVKVCYGE